METAIGVHPRLHQLARVALQVPAVRDHGGHQAPRLDRADEGHDLRVEEGLAAEQA